MLTDLMKRILIVWWGSSRGGAPTIGDYLAVSNVVEALNARGAQVEVAAHRPFDCHGVPVVNWWRASPLRYRSVVFVCGPLSDELYFRLLFSKFYLARKVAVGVSVVDRKQLVVRLLNEIVARDGLEESYFDLALAGELAASPTKRSDVVICLRGYQTEYGNEACHSERLDRVLCNVAERLGLPVRMVSTIVDPESNSIAAINQLFANAKIVLTTRLHGALLSLQHKVPFVAVDQIEGGAKLSAVIGRLGWEHLYPSSVDETTLYEACMAILGSRDIDERVRVAAVQAQELSRLALERSVEAILHK
jgi:hypothetical protein